LELVKIKIQRNEEHFAKQNGIDLDAKSPMKDNKDGNMASYNLLGRTDKSTKDTKVQPKKALL
jgi:hypothetical protein